MHHSCLTRGYEQGQFESQTMANLLRAQCAYDHLKATLAEVGNALNKNLPSNSSHTTSPVLGQMTIIPTLTLSSAPMPPRSCSTMHMSRGALFAPTSSTESISSTYLDRRQSESVKPRTELEMWQTDVASV